ncbi:MAG: hypothetical protein DWQ42_00570 [Planctomycetota bacterium]|nr:MAG: hypothetical protein DWQ42_00570 [Planctomycetota bacterium]REK40685.1 MAG: hypothetical protein DWQ46_15710 [Planctomycetota bacterium]
MTEPDCRRALDVARRNATCFVLGIVVIAACAADRAIAIEVRAVHLGLDGIYRLGFWTPILVEVDAEEPLTEATIEVIVPDGDATPVVYRLDWQEDSDFGRSRRGGAGEPARGSGDSAGDVVTYRAGGFIKVGRSTGLLTVQLLWDQEVVERTHFPLQSESVGRAVDDQDVIVMTLGRLEVVAERLSDLSRGQVATIRTAELEPATWPTNWLGYDAADVVILSASPTVAEHFANRPATRAALETWLRRGGRLLLAAGGAAPETLAADGPFAELLPGRFDKLVDLENTLRYEEFCRTADRLWSPERSQLDAWRVPRFVNLRGRVLLQETIGPTSVPLIVRHSYGLGEVAYLAGDLEGDDFMRWAGTDALLARLLPSRLQLAGAAAAEPLGAVGYDDMYGHLRRNLDDFRDAGVEPVRFWIVASLVLVYLVALVPGDFWLLRRLRGRMEWTWISVPLLILLTCTAAWAIAYGAHGTGMRINAAEVVDIDTTDGRLRSTLWFTIYSPRTARYDVRVLESQATEGNMPEAAVKPETILAWQGLPGEGLGGMHARGAASLFLSPYRLSPDRRDLQGVPIPVASTKTFRAQQFCTCGESVELDVQIAVGGAESELVGNVVNHLDHSIDDCLLFYRRWVYRLGTLAPNVETPLPEQWAPELSRYELTNNDVYDHDSEDLAYVLLMMMFYDQAGGREFSRLQNRQASYLDLSHTLASGRPILVGRADRGRLTASVDDHAAASDVVNQTSLYRFVFAPLTANSTEAEGGPVPTTAP